MFVRTAQFLVLRAVSFRLAAGPQFPHSPAPVAAVEVPAYVDIGVYEPVPAGAAAGAARVGGRGADATAAGRAGRERKQKGGRGERVTQVEMVAADMRPMGRAGLQIVGNPSWPPDATLKHAS